MYRDKFNQGLMWALLLAPCIAHAAGLGNLTVRSSLGQPLLAEIDLISVRKDDASTLIARLAPPEAYRKADLQYGAVLTGMRFSIEKRPGGEPYIKVMSTRAVNEPFVNLVVELSSSSGRFTREYTALIDPPGYTPPQSMAAAPEVPPPAAAARPIAPRSAPVAVPAPARAATAEKEYTVKRGDTLSKIAASVKPEGIALEQMLVGIFRNNPDAFMNNNMNRMRAGATLRIPESEQLAALPRGDAAKEVRVQTADWNRYRRRLSDRPGKAAENERSERKHDGRVKVEDKAAGKPKDVLKLSKGQPGDKKRRTIEDRLQALEEELIARERALNEANQRIKELEKTVKEAPK